jgi:hypothetical protein
LYNSGVVSIIRWIYKGTGITETELVSAPPASPANTPFASFPALARLLLFAEKLLLFAEKLLLFAEKLFKNFDCFVNTSVTTFDGDFDFVFFTGFEEFCWGFFSGAFSFDASFPSKREKWHCNIKYKYFILETI